VESSKAITFHTSQASAYSELASKRERSDFTVLYPADAIAWYNNSAFHTNDPNHPNEIRKLTPASDSQDST
jgi:hypothetical protein